MAQLETNEPRKDVNVRTAQLVQLLIELGPDIPEISRRLGQFKESVRYRYKEKLVNKGLAVQAMPDHEKLGLKRMVLIADFREEFRPYSQSILTAMSKLCYVVGFAKTLPHGEYVVSASVPAEYANQFVSLMEQLKEVGIFASVEVLDFEWFRNSPMRPEYYDFDSGRWDFDWSMKSGRDSGAATFMASEIAKFDKVDLLIISELQLDANKSLKQVADEIHVNYKKLAWHFATHVVERKLIRGYRINWMGTSYDFKTEKPLQRQHRYLFMELLVKNVSEIEKMTLRQQVNKLPFLWAEASGSHYLAEFGFPIEYVTEAYQYLEEAISNVRDRAEIFTIDQTNSLVFTIPYEGFQTEEKAWAFDPTQLKARFENLVLKIKEVGPA